MIRSFWIFLLQTLLLFSPLYAFEVKVSQSEFCIDNKPNTLIFTLTHSKEEEFQNIDGIENLGVLTNTIESSETETILVVAIDNNAIRADLHQVKIEMINTSTTSVTSQTLVIDVFDKLQRTVNFNRFSDLVYHCDYVSINFTTEGDTLTDELVLVYINDRFYKEQKLTVDGKVGKLEDLRIERPLEDSLQIEIFLESSRDNQCLNRVQIQEEGLEFIAPVSQGIINENYTVSTTDYGVTTFASNSLNSDRQRWEVYENGNLIGVNMLFDNEDFVYIFPTSNFEKNAQTPFKQYDVIIIATDASGAGGCLEGINRDTLKNVEIPYFPRVKVPTAVSKRSSFNEDGSYRLLIRNQVDIQSFEIEIFDASNYLVFQSEDYNFVFGDDETFNSSLYNAKILIHYSDGLIERLNTSFIVTP
ncbi:hypothetical protein [Flammeovirga sp. SJP92]|uniref:hypothetical protein n=1 Tax=Flammeovirga sp. SJP92 TaxID=1775430 RepID=UPI0007877D8E|nr:hypothetical protein [Flammeovirga sp. SJP92]KXX67923.1 hypothetical protein AVL50_23995 [Flammeovirga sp. SJP92]